MNNCKAISNSIAVKYKHDGPEMAMDIKNMENPMINLHEIPECTYNRVDIFMLDNK